MDNQKPQKTNGINEADVKKGRVLMQICKDLKKVLEEKLSKIQGQSGMSLKELKNFYDTKANFTEEKWVEFEKEKEKFESENKALVDYQKRIKTVVSSSKKKVKKFGNRARQRSNWMPM